MGAGDSSGADDATGGGWGGEASLRISASGVSAFGAISLVSLGVEEGEGSLVLVPVEAVEAVEAAGAADS